MHDGADVTVAERPGPASFSRIEAIKSEVRLIEADLSTAEGARQVTEGQEVVLNLAGKVASIQYNRHHHAEMFTANMRLANEVMEAAAANGVERFLVVSSACIYPFDAAGAPEGAGRPEDAGPPKNHPETGVAKEHVPPDVPSGRPSDLPIRR